MGENQMYRMYTVKYYTALLRYCVFLLIIVTAMAVLSCLGSSPPDTVTAASSNGRNIAPVVMSGNADAGWRWPDDQGKMVL
jgi:hypothetical protein